MVRESNNSDSIKFLCSYGGKILPRQSDYKLRYVGGHTRVLSVDRSLSYTELMVKLVEFCGFSATLKCQLPNGDLDTLISVKTDEELAVIIGEYDKEAAANPSSLIPKIRAVLAPVTNLKKVSTPLSTSSSGGYSYDDYRSSHSDDRLRRQAIENLSSRQKNMVPIGFPVSLQKSGCISPYYHDDRPTSGFCSGCRCNYLARLQQEMRLPMTHSRRNLNSIVYTQDRTR